MYLLHLPNGIISGTIGSIGGIPVGRPPVAGIPGNVVVVGADTEGWVNVEETVAVEVPDCGACVPPVKWETPLNQLRLFHCKVLKHLHTLYELFRLSDGKYKS